MRKANSFDKRVFLWVLAGVLVGGLLGAALLLWVVPGNKDYRPAVLTTIAVPVGCFVGWLLSSSRERAPTAALSCFGLYFLSAFAAARVATWTGSNYFRVIVPLQVLAGIGIAVLLGIAGRALPKVERLQDDRDTSGLAELLRQGSPLERREAARALGALGEESAREPLVAALADPDVLVARQAAAGLVGLATPADLPQLEAALRHSDPVVRRKALQALRWVDGDAARATIAAYRRRAG